MKIFKDYTDSYNVSFLELLSWKLTIFKTFLGETRRYFKNFSFGKYNSLKRLRNTKTGTAVICSLGPSIYENKILTRELLRKASVNNSLFAINHFLLTDYADILPTYQFLSDDNFFYDEANKSYLKHIEFFPTMTIFTRMANNYNFKNEKIVYFSGLNIPTFFRATNPKFLVGFADITILYAISIALFMGYSKVIICGFDNNRFMQIDSVSPGEIYFRGMHSYGQNKIEKWGTRNSMIKVLSSHLVILKSLLLFKNKEVFIVGKSSLVDIFPKIDLKTAIRLL